MKPLFLLFIGAALFLSNSIAAIQFGSSCSDYSSCAACAGIRLAPVQCPCSPSLLHNGVCDPLCNITDCWFDAGDCFSPDSDCRCLQTSLANGNCDPDCDNPQCFFDMGDCQSLGTNLECAWCESGSLCITTSDYCSSSSLSSPSSCPSGDQNGLHSFFITSFLPIILPIIIVAVCCIALIICGISIHRRQQQKLNQGITMHTAQSHPVSQPPFPPPSLSYSDIPPPGYPIFPPPGYSNISPPPPPPPLQGASHLQFAPQTSTYPSSQPPDYSSQFPEDLKASDPQREGAGPSAPSQPAYPGD